MLTADRQNTCEMTQEARSAIYTTLLRRSTADRILRANPDEPFYLFQDQDQDEISLLDDLAADMSTLATKPNRRPVKDTKRRLVDFKKMQHHLASIAKLSPTLSNGSSATTPSSAFPCAGRPQKIMPTQKRYLVRTV